MEPIQANVRTGRAGIGGDESDRKVEPKIKEKHSEAPSSNWRKSVKKVTFFNVF